MVQNGGEKKVQTSGQFAVATLRAKKYPFLVLCLIQPDSTVFCKLCLLGEKTTILFCNNRCKLHRGVVFIDL
jgi:hypothetical protein